MLELGIKAIEIGIKEAVKKAAEASIAKKFMQLPEKAQEINAILKSGDTMKKGIEKGAELLYDREAAEDSDLADMKSALKTVGDMGKSLEEKMAKKFEQLPEKAQGINEILKSGDTMKEGIEKVAEMLYDNEAAEDSDLADMKGKLKIEGDAGKSSGAEKAEKVERSPETGREINQAIMGSNPPELTRDEKIKLQDQVISAVENGEKTLNSTQEKGNFGEMKTDQDLRDKGYERISHDMVTDVGDSGHQGIDGVYANPDGVPPYLITDSKFGTGQLSDTLDGKQMSENWIDKRLDESVGKEKADEIRMEKLLNPDNVGSYVSHVDEKGNVSYDKLDENANIIEKDVKF